MEGAKENEVGLRMADGKATKIPMQRILLFFDGMPGYKKVWATLERRSVDGVIAGQIHKKTEDVLLGWGQLAREGRMYIVPGGMRTPIAEVTREGHFKTQPKVNKLNKPEGI